MWLSDGTPIVGELNLLKKFRAEAPTNVAVRIGPGHDCAVLDWPAHTDLLFKMDQVVEGTHFLLSGSEAATPKAVGAKAIFKACSDIAAAGGRPTAVTVALNIRKGSNESLALEVFEGLRDACLAFGIGLAGGDFCTSENGLSIAVSMLGECPRGKAWTRGGARPGDALLLTGALGASRAGKHLNFQPRVEEARLIRALCENGVHACIDITDGLSRDLRHLCEESQCGARLETQRVPLSADALRLSSDRAGAFQRALSDGEDFELLLAVEPSQAEELLKKWNSPTPLTRIGEILPKECGLKILNSDGSETPLIDSGYEHHV